MVDAADLKSAARKGVWVRHPPSAPIQLSPLASSIRLKTQNGPIHLPSHATKGRMNGAVRISGRDQTLGA